MTFSPRYFATGNRHPRRPRRLNGFDLVQAPSEAAAEGTFLARFYAVKSQTLASAQVHYLHRILHKAFACALRWGLVPRNVADAVDAPRVRQDERPVLTQAQVQTLVDHVRIDRL